MPQLGIYLPHSTLDTSHKIYSSSILIYQPINGYTELAFEHVWLFSYSIPVQRELFGVNVKFVSLVAKSQGTERRSWPGSQFKRS